MTAIAPPRFTRITVAKGRKTPAAPATTAAVDRHQEIAIAAYFLAERRQFAAGGELEDWLAAESELAAATAVRA